MHFGDLDDDEDDYNGEQYHQEVGKLTKPIKKVKFGVIKHHNNKGKERKLNADFFSKPLTIHERQFVESCNCTSRYSSCCRLSHSNQLHIGQHRNFRFNPSN